MRKEEETLGSYIMPASGYVDNLRIYNVTRTQTEIQASMFGAGVIWEDITVNESAWLTQQQYAQALDDWQGSYMQVFLPQLSEEATQSILVGWPKAWTAAQRRKTGLIQSFDFNEDPYMLAASPKYTNLVNASPSQYNPDSMSSETSPFPLRGKLLYAISVTQTGDSVILVHCYHDNFTDCDFDPPIEREEYLTLSIAIEAGQRPKVDAARAIINTNANHYLQVFGADDAIPNEMTIQLFHKPFQHADGSIFARLMRLNGTNLPLSLSYRRSRIVLQVGGYELSRDMQLQATNVQAGIDPGYFYEACLLTFTTTLTATGDLKYEVIYVSTLDGNATTVMSEIAQLSHILAGQGYDGSNFETLGHSVYFGSGFMANSEGQLNPYRIYYGLMDDVKIWNRVLTLEEIKASRGIRETNNSPGLLAYVTFDQFPVGIVHNHTDNHVHFPVIYETVAGANETSSGVTGQAIGHKYGLTPIALYKNVGEYDQIQAPGISSNPASYVCDVSVDGYRDPCMDQLYQQVNNEIDVLILTIRTLPVFGTLLRRNLTELQVNDTVVLPLSDEGLALVLQAFSHFNGTHPLVEDEFFGSPLVYDAPATSGLDAFAYSVRSPTLASDFEYVIAQIQVLLPSPALTSAITSDCKDVDTMTFDQNDCIRLTFSTDVREVDMHGKSSVDQYITFSCDLGDSDYYGKWAYSSLYIIFKSVDANVPVPVYEVPCSVTVSNVNTDKQMTMPNSTVAMTGNWGVAQGIDHMTAIWMGGVLGLITIGMFIFVCFNRDHQAIRCTAVLS
ncbi:hypothetical protein SARC_03544 [Sphaeroforma arctica JP610]|uniref:Uncharacterized protein n=1 Tax=Sphaeroforma arctica JP610 TaxID=667725 RepID=A0A0L0G5M1_9EUKA|nr:hypothetical protein SARC_03544 [Sphaeroforma arctica JP610]KNC84244.1 hypothetical protein SARC_03544 [Sphaeroforma arctica JP610]|eukprot:XP_014158146.1 hypothetical protein SARC_03544 [Sphaeroforma arctica JP610]